MTRFYLGTHEPAWLSSGWFWLDRDRWNADVPDDSVPMFVSHERLADRRQLDRALRPWACDSGGYGQITRHGNFLDSPAEYVAAVRRYEQEIGRLEWAASQDHMMEDKALKATGLTVADHHRLTVENYVELVDLWGGDPATALIKPTLQGRTPDDYARHWDLYYRYGVDLNSVSLLALGSVCRLQATPVLGAIIRTVRSLSPTVPLHGFGVKSQGLALYGHELASADSLAWSDGARRRRVKHWRCRKTHEVCSSCPVYALDWRDNTVLPALAHAGTGPQQLDLFTEGTAA
jgi:hypothetical protein